MARGVAVSSTAVVVAAEAPSRIAVSFAVGDAANSSSVVLRDLIDATAANGVPLAWSGGVLRIEGAAASRRWTAIRLAAVDCVVGVIEEFHGDWAGWGEDA